MTHRIKLADRVLPNYSRGEELMNMTTHIVGGVLGVIALVLCTAKSISIHNGWGLVSSLVYGISLIVLYTISSVYHGMKPCTAKKVMQVIDHCTIYLLISGSYTVVVLSGIRPVYPALGWGLFIFEWAMTAVAVTLTAIDLKKYEIFSMVCYIGMGWAVIPFWHQTLEVLEASGFGLLLGGGIAYTIGAVLYGVGIKRKWMHSVFHIFVVLGSLLQFLSVVLYAI